MTDASEVDEGLVKVVFDVPDEDGRVFETESVWAEPLGSGRYRLRNVPFVVFGFSEQDVVKAMESEGLLKVTGVATRGGHSTYRLILPADSSEEQFLRDWLPLQELGCTYERATRRFVAIDVPPTSDIYAVYRVLETGEAANRWEFEEAHCGHLEPK